MPVITFNLNGNPVSVDADNDEELLWVLRDRLHVHGLKFGCGMGLCGACTSHIDGVAKRTCITPIHKVAGHNVTTIEGLAKAILKNTGLGDDKKGPLGGLLSGSLE